jgi:hypothetical protein
MNQRRWKMKPELKPFQHIIDILFNRDGWIKLPLFDRQEVKINGKTKYTTVATTSKLYIYSHK